MSHGPHSQSWSRLSRTDQLRFDAMVREYGTRPTADRLGITDNLVNKLYGSGHATAEAVERVSGALAKFVARQERIEAT